MSDNRQSLADLGATLNQQAAAAPAQTAAAGEAPAAPAERVSTTPLRQQELDKFGRAYATGRRKDAVARVWLKPG